VFNPKLSGRNVQQGVCCGSQILGPTDRGNNAAQPKRRRTPQSKTWRSNRAGRGVEAIREWQFRRKPPCRRFVSMVRGSCHEMSCLSFRLSKNGKSIRTIFRNFARKRIEGFDSVRRCNLSARPDMTPRWGRRVSPALAFASAARRVWSVARAQFPQATSNGAILHRDRPAGQSGR